MTRPPRPSLVLLAGGRRSLADPAHSCSATGLRERASSRARGATSSLPATCRTSTRGRSGSRSGRDVSPLHGEVRALLAPASALLSAGGAFRSAGACGRARRSDRDRPCSAGHVDRDVPGRDATAKGLRKRRGSGAHRCRAHRARGRRAAGPGRRSGYRRASRLRAAAGALRPGGPAGGSLGRRLREGSFIATERLMMAIPSWRPL